MIKRILISLALVASLGGAIAACNNPSGTASPAASTGTLPTEAPSIGTESPSTGTESAMPSAS